MRWLTGVQGLVFHLIFSECSSKRSSKLKKYECVFVQVMPILVFIVSVTPGERTSNGFSPLASVGIRSLSGEPVPCPLMSVLPVGVR